MATATLFLAGDVMTGRGIDQILPHPGDPAIFEDYLTSARDYVALAECKHGKIQAPVDFGYIWGDALDELEAHKPAARIVNLETCVTSNRTPEPKGVNYKMNPANMPALMAAGLDCCALANNHALDWGEAGLLETLSTLDAAGIEIAGAGVALDVASQPAVMPLGPAGRICVYGLGSTTSGIPLHWAAGKHKPGVRLLPDLSEKTAKAVAAEILAEKRSGDITALSIHWGSNWGYRIPEEQKAFAHTLIELGACDILHGHSSHHARGIEVYRGKLILYGCGDFVTDYEGIRGYENYRGDLSVMYLPSVNIENAALEALTLIVFQMRRFRLQRASLEDVKWWQGVINRESRSLGTRLSLDENGRLHAEWS